MIASKVRLASRPKKGDPVAYLVPGESDRAALEWPGDAAPGDADGFALGTDLKAAGADLVLAMPADDEAPDSHRARRAGARLRRGLEGAGVTAASFVRPAGSDLDLAAFVEGFCLGGYRFQEFMAKARHATPVSLTVVGSGKADKAAVAEGQAAAEEQARVRTWVNLPAENMHPETLAAAAKAAAKRTPGLKVKVHAGKNFAKQFPAIHAVGRASKHPPCMIQVTYAPKGAKKHYAVIGKGITYDSGGLHVKPLNSMVLMKKDMAAAAAVLGAVEAVARRKLKVKVTALLCCAENMISPDSYRPGDIIDSRSGQTIEIRSTDAEGRLVMSDGLAFAAEMKPDLIMDLGTLTGVAARFVGDACSPVTGTDKAAVGELMAAGDAAHERLFHVPMLREFRDATKGTISDLRNWGTVGGHAAGTMVCAGFLSHFVRDLPWVHVDMSNGSWATSDRDEQTTGGTGYGVRLLTEFFTRVSA